MKKRVLALLLAITTLFSTSVFSGCDLSLTFGSDSSDGSSDVGSVCKEHTDKGNDGVCDVCEQGVMVDLDIFAVNDLHGKVRDGSNHPGVDEFTTYYKQAKAANPNTMLISSGDMWQGAAASNLTKGMLVNDWMNEVGFVSMTLGNHEFDWGEEYIAANQEQANFPFLALNIYNKTTGKRVDYCDASVMYETNGAKIGVIGAIGDCYSSLASDYAQNVEFKVGSELTALVKQEAQNLRTAGADFIVYSLHGDHRNSGEYDASLSDGYVDIVFEGHTHQAYTEQDNNGVYHLQGGGDNYGVSRAKVSLNIANEKYTVNSAEAITSSVYQNLAKDPVVNEISEKYKTQIEMAEKVVGYNEKLRQSTEIGNTVAQLYLEAGEKRWGDDYDIVLAGGLISVRSPYQIGVGEVEYGALMDVLPFDNQLVLCSLSGQKLLDQFVDNSRYYTKTSDTFNQSSISLTGTYYIITDSYSSPYPPNGCTEIQRYDAGIFARDLLAEYIGTGAWGELQTLDITPISEILKIGAGLSHQAETSEEYVVQGEIISTPTKSGKYTTTYIRDENGDELYIYGFYDESGTTEYNNLPYRPQVGDTVVLQGVVKKYNSDIEIFKARLIDYTIGGTTSGGGSGTGGTGSGGTGTGGTGTGGTGSGGVTTGDPYTNVSQSQFYANYTPATDYMDAYYRSQHYLMSGELTVPDQAPTVAKSQPTKNGKYIKNTNFRYEDDGKTYVVVDASGAEAFRVYKDGAYITLEEVAAYVYAFGTYPKNYTTSKNTKPTSSDWGKYLRLNHTSFSGDTSSYPYEPVLPNISGCGGDLNYYEMDIGTTGTDCDPSYTAALYNTGSKITRGAARIVYGKYDLDKDGVYEHGELHLFYTYNHYNDFQEYLNYEGGWGEMFGNITGGGTISSRYDYNPTDYVSVYWGLLSDRDGSALK